MPTNTPEPTDDRAADQPGKRRMPDNLRRFLIRMQGGKQYLPAAYRIVWFRDECPDWGIETVLLEGGHEAGFCTVGARVLNAEGRIVGTGMKTECKADFPAGWVEKAESGAIARALAVAGFGTQFTPDLDDDGEGSRPVSAASASSSPSTGSDTLIWQGPGLCPNCHAPEGKRHGRPCVG